MIDVTQMLQFIAMLIPIATFGALIVSMILFVKNKGTVDALREAARTYQTLAESKSEALEDTEEKLKECKARTEQLETMLEEKSTAVDLAIDKLIEGFKRSGNTAG